MHTTEQCVRHALDRLSTVRGFEKVRFIILFGSAAEGRAKETSDIDLCIGYEGDREEGARFRLAVLSELYDDRYDVQIFENLPLYVRMEVLRGRVVYCPDEHYLYDVAYQTIREFDAFKHRLYDYIGTQVIV